MINIDDQTIRVPRIFIFVKRILLLKPITQYLPR